LQIPTVQLSETEPTDGDPEWTRQLSGELARAFIVTKAVLDDASMTLEEAANLTVGSTIPLSTVSISKARLEIDDRPVFWCALGRSNMQLAVCIASNYDNEADVMVEF
jgi:flagellar motor switch protein FliM